MFKALTLAGLMAIGTVGLAHAGDMAGKPMRGPHDGPCAPVVQACKDAGFTRGGMKNGKGLMENCLKPLSEGKKVAGVAVDKSKLDSCNAHHAERKAKFEERMKNDPEFAKKVQEHKAQWKARHESMKKAPTIPTN